MERFAARTGREGGPFVLGGTVGAITKKKGGCGRGRREKGVVFVPGADEHLGKVCISFYSRGGGFSYSHLKGQVSKKRGGGGGNSL